MSRIYVTPMPVNSPNGAGTAGGGANAGGSGQQGGQRATFRPPWVKQGPQPIPMPTAPWAPSRRPSNPSQDGAATNQAAEPAPARKQSKITIIPSHPTNQQSAPPPKENGQNGSVAFSTEDEADSPGGAFARLAALVRRVEDMGRRHEEQTEEVLRRPSLANLTAFEEQPPMWALDDHQQGVLVDEPDWWRDMQLTARRQQSVTPETPATEDVGEDVQPGRGSSPTGAEEPPGRWADDGVEEVEAVEDVVMWREDARNEEEVADDENADVDVDIDDAEPAGSRRPMARTDTVERKIPVQVAAATPDSRRADKPADNGRVADEPRKRPSLTHQKSSNAPRAQEPQPPASAPQATPQSTPQATPQAPPPPPAPPAPPAPPMAPPPPPLIPDKKPLTSEQKQKLDTLRNRARKRPDYSFLMKEIEGGKKLKRVQCNDRSRPLLPKTKAKGQYIYESEKSNQHNQLLKQIETGVRLKRVKTNDRSKPILDGLRKFRRQMTVEEQLQKADAPVELTEEPDELDDIDRVRDDLQSTKQMLALELRNKEAMERENKRLLARLLNLEAELEAERNRQVAPQAGQAVAAAPAADTDRLIANLKEENETQQKVAKEMEQRYHQSAEELDSTKAQLQEALFQKKQAEKQLKEIEDGLVEGGRALQKQLSKKLISSRSGDIRKQMSQARLNEMRKQSIPVPEMDQEDSESDYTDETITDSEEEKEEDLSNDPEAQEKRVQRELKLLATKLKAFKDKEASARRERTALREQLKLQQKSLREERAKYKSLQKEVDKMAKLMKEDDDEEGEDEEDEEEEEEEESEESETEEDEEEPEASGDELPADAPADDKRANLNTRTRRHEGILGALKKGNYLLKANIDRIKDDLSKHREMSLMLQEDLNSVLAELG